MLGVVIFFSLTEPPLPNPTPTSPNTPKRTQNGPETDPKQTRNGPEMDRNQVLWGGMAGGSVGMGGVGGL